MAKQIIIGAKEFMQGIADSPILGNGFMTHCNISSKFGAICSNGSVTAGAFNTGPTDEIMQIRTNPLTGTDYILDRDNNLYSISTTTITKIVPGSGTPTTGDAIDMAIYRNCIFIFLRNKIDLYDITNDTWYPDWASGDFSFSCTFIPNLVAEDDKLYFATDNEINSIEAQGISTFDPSTSSTWDSVEAALDIPEHYEIKTLVEYNNVLVMGTQVGANFYKVKTADIYSWDKVSPSFAGPISAHENGINQMIVANGLVYFTAGTKQNMYVTDLTRVELIKKMHILPFNSTGIIEPLPNAIMYHKNKIYIGIGTTTGTPDRPLGVYSIDIKNNNALNYENTIVGGDADKDGEINVLTSISTSRYLIGYKDQDETPDWGVDVQRDTALYQDDSVAYESRLYEVGTKRHKRTFESIEVVLLNTTVHNSQGITVYAREHPNDAWGSAIATKVTHSANGAFDSWYFPFSRKWESIQVKVVMDDDDTPSIPLYLKNIIIT